MEKNASCLQTERPRTNHVTEEEWNAAHARDPAIDEALNAAVSAHGVYAEEIREGRLAPMHADVETMRPLENMRSRTLPAHVFYTVVAYQKDGWQ